MSFWKNLHPLLRKDKDDYGSANSAILNAIDTSLSDAEREEVATKVQRSLDTATGEYLDYWGRWFNSARRYGETDDDYRERIKYYLLMGRGTVQGIIDGLKYWLQDNALYAEVYEPWYNIFTLNKSKLNDEDSIAGSYYRYTVIDVKLDRPISKEILDIIYAYKPAGVIVYTTYEPNLNIKANALSLANLNTNFKEQTLSNYGGVGDYGGNVIGFGDLDEVAMQSMSHTLFTTNDSKTNGEDYISSNIFSGKLYVHKAWSWSSDGKDRFMTVYPGRNLIVQSDLKAGFLNRNNGGPSVGSRGDFYSDNYIATNGATVFTFSSPDYAFKSSINHTLAMYDSDKIFLGYQTITSATQTLSKPNVAYIRFSINFTEEGGTSGNLSDWLGTHRYKLETGTLATPYTPSPLDDPEGAYPQFIGTYTDYIADDSTDPTKYTWVKVQDPQDSTISDSDIGTQKSAYYVGLSGSHRNLLTGTSNQETSGTIPANAWNAPSQHPRILVTPGQTLTYQIFITNDNTVDLAAGVDATLGNVWKTTYVGNFIKAGTSGRSYVTFTIPSGVDNITLNNTKVALNNPSSDIIVHWKEEKLELGTTASSWSPAPEDNVANLPDSSSTWVQDGIRQATKLEDNVKSGNIFNNGNNNIFGEIRIQEFLLSKYSAKDYGNILATSTLSPYIEVSGVLSGNANIVISQVSYPILNGRTLIPIKVSDIIKDSTGISKIPFCLMGEEGATLDLDKIVFGYKFLREKETGVAVSADHVIKSVN